MSYKCKICGVNDVEHMGDICELCAVSQDPYAAALQGEPQPALQEDYSTSGNRTETAYMPMKGRSRKVLLGGGNSMVNTDPYGNSIVPQDEEEDKVQVYRAGQVPLTQQSSDVVDQDGSSMTSGTRGRLSSKSTEPVTHGITKNISVDTEKRSFIVKWFQSLTSGIPFTLEDDITMFQVFPDFSGTSLNAMGNACDQVIVYGKLKAGAVSENNDVEIYGHRDPDNNVIAKTIKNKATGTTITPDGAFSAAVVWGITLAVAAVIALVFLAMGVEGIVWAIVLIICLTNLPLVFKILAAIFGFLFSFLKK